MADALRTTWGPFGPVLRRSIIFRAPTRLLLAPRRRASALGEGLGQEPASRGRIAITGTRTAFGL